MLTCFLKMLLLGLGAALLGYLLGRLLSRPRVQQLEADLDTQRNTHNKLKGDYDLYVSNFNLLHGKHSQLEKDHQDLGLQLNDVNAKFSASRNDFGLLLNDKNKLQLAFDDLKIKSDADLLAARNAAAELNAKYQGEIDTLQAKFKALTDEKDALVVLAAKERHEYELKTTQLNGELGNLRNSLTALEAEKINLNSSLSALESDKLALSGKLSGLESNNSNFALQIAALTGQLNDSNKTQESLDSLQKQYNALLADSYDDSNEIKSLEAKLTALSDEKGNLQKQYNALLADSYDDSNEIKALEAKLAALSGEKDSLQKQYNALLADSYDDSNEIKSLEAKLAALSGEKDSLQKQYNALLADSYDDSNEIKALEAKLTALSGEKDSLQKQYNALLADSYDDSNEIKALEAKLAECEASKAQMNRHVISEGEQSFMSSLKPADLEEYMRLRNKAANLNFGRIGLASFAERDDLQLLKGVGPFIERKLFAVGIYTFRQIANFTEEDEDMVNDAIEFFPGRIRRERWCEQSSDLLKLRASGMNLSDFSEDELTIARIKGKIADMNYGSMGTATSDQADDLKIIKGIGDFIERKLNALGVYTFRQIANFTEGDITAVSKNIELMQGQIEREDWINQAREFDAQKEQ